MKIILMGDVIYTSLKTLNRMDYWVLKAFAPMIKDAVAEDIEVTFSICNNEGVEYSREKFFSLGINKNPADFHQEYKVKDFTPEQIDYLKKFVNNETIIIGFEIYKPLCDLLSTFGVKVIDLAFHPYKLFDDLAFGVYVNDKDVYNELLKYQIPQDKFYYFANYWKTFMEYNRIIEDKDLKDNSALFIGQTLKDRSVDDNGKFLNVTDYNEKLKELKETYSTIYYLPHPYLGRHRKMIYDWVKKSPYIELITNRSTYGLLASDKVKKIIGISTSVLYEAQYFNKKIEYLFKPLFNVDVPFEEHSYISVLDDFTNPKFWADILKPICEINPDVQDINYFKPSHNKLRNLNNSYWGYSQLDAIKRIPNFEESMKNLYRQYIAPLF